MDEMVPQNIFFYVLQREKIIFLKIISWAVDNVKLCETFSDESTFTVCPTSVGVMVWTSPKEALHPDCCVSREKHKGGSVNFFSSTSIDLATVLQDKWLKIPLATVRDSYCICHSQDEMMRYWSQN